MGRITTSPCRGHVGARTWMAALALTAQLTGCTGTTEPSAQPTPSSPTRTDATTGAPAPEWDRVAPAEAGFDPGRLRDVVREARRKQSTCFVAVRDGRLVTEEYWRGGSATQANRGFSVTKSVVSTLVGVARDRGLLDLDQSAARYVERWPGTPAAKVTLLNLLSNDSGREWSAESDYSRLLQATDHTAYGVADAARVVRYAGRPAEPLTRCEPSTRWEPLTR